MVEHATDRVIRITQHSTLDRVLDQLREVPPGGATLLLDPLSVLFATPDHFRALDAVRLARRLSLTIEVQDAHRTGLALAFGYRVRPLGEHLDHRTTPVPDVVLLLVVIRWSAVMPPCASAMTLGHATAARSVGFRDTFARKRAR